MRDKAIRRMRYLSDPLQRQPNVAGERFSMADIAVLGGMIFASLVKLPVPNGCEALLEWHARMQDRPSVQQWRAMVERGAPQRQGQVDSAIR